MNLIHTIIVVYLLVGSIEYIRLRKDYNRKLQDDFPSYNVDLLRICTFFTLFLFSFPLVVSKAVVEFLRWTKRITRKLTFPYRLWRFKQLLQKAADEKDAKKSVEMIFEAMAYIVK